MSRRQLPGVLGVSILFWAWTVDLWLLGLIFAILLEAPLFIHWRYRLPEKELIRWLWLMVVIVGTSLVAFIILQLNEGIYTFIQWFPLTFFPIVIFQVYYAVEKFPKRVIVRVFNRKSSYVEKLNSSNEIDFRLFYFFIVLVASSISAPLSIAVFLFYGVISIMGLYHLKPTSLSLQKWVGIGCLVLSLAFFIQEGLVRLQVIVEETTTAWLSGDWADADIFQSYTALGRIGKLKLSSEIIMRIKSSEIQPLLLKQASYSNYLDGRWHMRSLTFQDVRKESNTDNWLLSEPIVAINNKLTVSTYLKKGEAVLALPYGSQRISNLKFGNLSQNQYGSVRLNNGPNILDYDVYYNEESGGIAQPIAADLHVPPSRLLTLKKFANQAAISNQTPEKSIEKLKHLFETDFRYSLIQEGKNPARNPLDDFLLNSHKGHCEYFATAAALILRTIGIPTRYVTGYAMSEYDPDLQSYVVRKRHSHAWIIAFVNNRWVPLDYTPSRWAEFESDADPWWQGVSDELNLFDQRFKRLFSSNDSIFLYLGFLIFPIIVIGYYKKWIVFGKDGLSWSSNLPKNDCKHEAKTTPFSKIISELELIIGPRHSSETIKNWILRFEYRLGSNTKDLIPLLNKHYEIVYGNVSYSEQELGEFEAEVRKWINSKSTTT